MTTHSKDVRVLAGAEIDNVAGGYTPNPEDIFCYRPKWPFPPRPPIFDFLSRFRNVFQF